MKQNRNIVTVFLLIAIIICALVGAWHLSGTDSTENNVSVQTQDTIITTENHSEKEEPAAQQEKVPEASETPEAVQKEEENSAALEMASPPQMETLESDEPTCTLSVRCDDVLNHMDKLTDAKQSVIPQNGIILAEETFSFSEGESVFGVLLRVLREKKIHFEYVDTPMYNSAYIEGIGNLYEFDCSDTSGWMYRVNGIKPNYGCSQYTIKPDDKIEFYYQCSMFE